MGKCTACSRNECGGDYNNRVRCKDPKNCSCTCQESSGATFWKGFASITVGVGAFVGGVALTVATGGLGAVGIASVLAGGALTGAGATAAIQPIAKQMSGERMTGGDYVKEVAIGSVVGVATGGIGAGGASITTSLGTQGLVKFGCRTGVGAVSGAAASVIQDGLHGEFNLTNVAKGAALGAVTGGVGHVANKVADSGVTKVVVDTASYAAIDAGYQKVVDGEVDMGRLALNVGARAAMSTAYEVTSNATYDAMGGKERLQEKLADQKIMDQLSPEDQEKVRTAKQYVEALPPEKIQEQIYVADDRMAAKDVLQCREEIKAFVNDELRTVVGKIEEIPRGANPDRAPLIEERNDLMKQRNDLGKMINADKQEVGKYKTDRMGPQKVHVLDGEHRGQIAANLNDVDRGRVVFDPVKSQDGNVRVRIAGVTDQHDYGTIPVLNEAILPELNEVKPLIAPVEKKKKRRVGKKDE